MLIAFLVMLPTIIVQYVIDTLSRPLRRRFQGFLSTMTFRRCPGLEETTCAYVRRSLRWLVLAPTERHDH